MQTISAKSTQAKSEAGLIFFITLIALILRLAPALTTNFPLNDGGLFYSMIRDLQAKHFSLPILTSYNHADLPYAYPPLAFYITGFISGLFQIDPLDLLRFLPPVVSAISIPAFSLLAGRMTRDSLQRVFAVLLFAFTPLAFEWQVMGGGITRSLGQLFAIFAFVFAHDYYSAQKRSSAIALTLASALVVLTHPEAAMQTAIGIIAIAFCVGHSKKLILPTFGIGLGVFLLSSPWWATLLSRFGLDPFLAAFNAAGQSGGPFLIRLILLFQFNVTEEPFVTFTACLGQIGMFIAFSRRYYLLPAWMLSALLIDPRGGARFAMFPLSLLAGLTLSAIWSLFDQNRTSKNGSLETALLGSGTKRLLFGYLFVALLLGAFVTMQNIQTRQTVTGDGLAAVEWIRQNTSLNATFVTITDASPLLDPFTEWLPALTERRVATSIFGYEWLNDGRFGARMQSHRDLQACLSVNADCVLGWINANAQAEYVIIASSSTLSKGFPLQVWLMNDSRFKQVYDNETVVIYQARK